MSNPLAVPYFCHSGKQDGIEEQVVNRSETEMNKIQ